MRWLHAILLVLLVLFGILIQIPIWILPLAHTHEHESTAFEQCLGNASFSSAAQVVLPGASAYGSATSSNNGLYKYDAAAIVFLGVADDATAAIRCAASYKIPVVTRCGRHSYASFGSGGQNGGLIIDTTALKNYAYDSATGLATAGMGMRLGDLALNMDRTGRGTPHGTCPYVGMGGHGTCGGFGMWSRKYGLFVDQIVGARVAIANGTIVDATKTQNPDLLWAVRGAGPSFGSVLAITIKTYPQPPTVTRFYYYFPTMSDPTTAANFFMAFQTYSTSHAPSELGLRIVLLKSGRSLSANIHGVYYGATEDFLMLLKPLLDALPVTATSSNVKAMSYMDAIKTLDASGNQLNSTLGSDPSGLGYKKSVLVPTSQPLSLATWTSFAMYSLNVAPPSGVSWWAEIDAFGGSFNGAASGIPSISDDENSFGGRDGLVLFQLAADSRNALSDAAYVWIDNWEASISASAAAENKTVKAYQCYVDARFTADQAHAAYFGPNKTARLTSLKQTWDPMKVFNYPHSF